MVGQISKSLLYSTSELNISDLRDLSDTYQLDDMEQQKYNELTQWVEEQGVVFALSEDDTYHFKFGLIKSAPYVVTMLGDTSLLNCQMIGIVGPRKYSDYAVDGLNELFRYLPHYDLVTVSGLADGVDSIGHQLSMDNAIPTIAVLGGGLRNFLRSGRREFIRTIVDHGGLVISEFKLDMAPTTYTFPQRNRIIAGLSDVLFLPEAGEKSGSLITVDFAVSMNKDVYGIPARFDDLNSLGLLHYMQQGLVTPVVNIEEMLGGYFGLKQQITDSVQPGGLFLETDEQTEIVQVLLKNSAGLSLNALVSQTGLSTEEVMSQLSMAEVMGQVKNSGGVWSVVR